MAGELKRVTKLANYALDGLRLLVNTPEVEVRRAAVVTSMGELSATSARLEGLKPRLAQARLKRDETRQKLKTALEGGVTMLITADPAVAALVPNAEMLGRMDPIIAFEALTKAAHQSGNPTAKIIAGLITKVGEEHVAAAKDAQALQAEVAGAELDISRATHALNDAAKQAEFLLRQSGSPAAMNHIRRHYTTRHPGDTAPVSTSGTPAPQAPHSAGTSGTPGTAGVGPVQQPVAPVLPLIAPAMRVAAPEQKPVAEPAAETVAEAQTVKVA